MAKWTLVSKHEYEFISDVPQTVKTIFALVIGICLAGGGFALIVYGRGGNSDISVWIFGILGILLGGLTLWVTILLRPGPRLAWVRVYEEGLRWKRGSQEHKKRWHEVKDVSRMEMQTINQYGQNTDWGRSASTVLHFFDGTSVSFDPSLQDYDLLARKAQEFAAGSQLAEGAAELGDEGKTFGLIHVTREAVTAFGKRFSWKKARWLTVENGHLVAHPACDGWEPVPLAAVDNYAVLLTLLQGIGRLRDHGWE